MTDADLVKRFRRGDRDAFDELVRRHARPLTIALLGILRDEEDAKDISQTALLKAYNGLPRFMAASSFKTWLYRIAFNAARDHLRRRRRHDSEEIETIPAGNPSAGESIDADRRRARLREAIERLPEKQRLTLQLRVYEEMDYQEIERILGGTPGTGRANFFQAVRTLRRTMGADNEKH